MTLLMVNDDEIIIDAMKTDIPWSNYQIDRVFLAYNSDAAKEIIMEEDIDIILCDIEMPGENGLELCGWIRKNNLNIKLAFLTCHADFDYAREAIGLQCEDYILMPAKYEEIGDCILRVVKKIEREKQNHRYQMYYESMMQEALEDAIGQFGEKLTPEMMVEYAVTIILKNLSNDQLTVSYIAEQIPVHPVYMSRVFTRCKGMSVKQFIIQERMEKAAQLLCKNQLSVTAVAEKVGYGKTSNFISMFKKYYGCTPANYIKEHKV